MLKSIIVTGVLCAAAAASAQTARSTSGSGSAAADDDNRVICRTISRTESRLSRERVCKTRAEWAEMRRETRSAIDRAQTSRVDRRGQ